MKYEKGLTLGWLVIIVFFIAVFLAVGIPQTQYHRKRSEAHDQYLKFIPTEFRYVDSVCRFITTHPIEIRCSGTGMNKDGKRVELPFASCTADGCIAIQTATPISRQS